LRDRVHRAFSDQSSVVGFFVTIVSYALIIASVASFCLSTLPDARRNVIDGVVTREMERLLWIDRCCLFFFGLDYCVRLATASVQPLHTESYDVRAHAEWRAAVDEATRPPAARWGGGAGVAPGAPAADHLTELDASWTVHPPRWAAGIIARAGRVKAGECARVPVTELVAAEPQLPVAFRRGGGALFALGLDSRDALLRTLASLIAFVFAPLNLIDLAAILPLVKGSSLMLIRVVRMARIARLSHLSRRLTIVRLMFNTMLQSGEALFMMVLMVSIISIFFGAIAFFIEEGDYDAETREWWREDIDGTGIQITPFRSIPVAVWWAIVTLTTVGYGDIVPSTPLGRLFGAATVFSGIVVLSLPITILGSNFSEENARYLACVAAGGSGFDMTMGDYRAMHADQEARRAQHERRDEVEALREENVWLRTAVRALIEAQGLESKVDAAAKAAVIEDREKRALAGGL
jgi:hypothetical protein